MKKGGLFNFQIGIIIVVFAAIMIIPLVLSSLFPIFKWIMLGFFCVSIYLFVRNTLGPGILAYAISAVLIYILIVRLWWLYSAAYMFYLVCAFGFTGIIIFGLQGVGMKHEEVQQ